MQKLYELRHDFAVIGLTGRTGAGCTQIADRLTDENYIEKLNINPSQLDLDDVDEAKLNICLNYLRTNENWKSFSVLKYTNVILYLLLLEVYFTNNGNEKNMSDMNGTKLSPFFIGS